MKRIRHWFWAAAKSYWMTLIAVVYLAMFFVPANWLWYEHLSLMVSNTPIGQTPSVVMKRKIKRKFEGMRTIQVLPIPPTDGEPHCATSRVQRYNPGQFEDLSTTLEEWTREVSGCMADDFTVTGSYYVTACITVIRPFHGLVPDKQTCIDSGPFEIMPPNRPSVVVVSPPVVGATDPELRDSHVD